MKAGHLFLALCIVLGTAFLTSLGLWQLQRLAWKEGLIARVEEGIRKPPVAVDEIESMLARDEDIEYRPAIATGRFHHDREAHFFATHKGRSGYFVYAPLELASGVLLMVNRGFVPALNKDQSTRKKGLIEGEVTITGLARSAPSDKPNMFVPDNDLTKNVFHWKSIDQMFGDVLPKPETRAYRFFLDADNTPVPGGLPVGGVTLIQFPNSHLQYAFTWFGLAGALLVVGGIFLVSRLRGRDDENAVQSV